MHEETDVMDFYLLESSLAETVLTCTGHVFMLAILHDCKSKLNYITSETAKIWIAPLFRAVASTNWLEGYSTLVNS